MTEKGYLHRRTKNFGKMPFALIVDTTISSGATRLYAYMHWRYGANCDNHEGRESMAETLGVSKKTITKYLQELEAADWIIVVTRKGKRGRDTNYYHVFELQDDCKQWRVAKRKPKPQLVVTTRKGRSGIGGQPTHKNGNSSSSSKPACEEGNSSSPTLGNSSSHDPDSYDPEKKTAPAPTKADNAPIGADSSDDDQRGQVENDEPVQEQWGYHVGQQAFWWYDDGNRWVAGTITRFTAHFAYFETKDKHGQVHIKKRGRKKCSPDGSTETWTLVSELPPIQQVIAMHSYHMKPEQPVSESRMKELNGHAKDLRIRFQNGKTVEAPELRAAYGWNKAQGMSGAKKRGGIGDMMQLYRDTQITRQPVKRPDFIHVDECNQCNLGMVRDTQGRSVQCPNCLALSSQEPQEEIA